MQEETHFAPAERATQSEVIENYHDFVNNADLSEIFDSVSSVTAILNEERQVVYVNKQFINSLNIPDVIKVLGKRPGEVLSCVHATEMPAGCGTSETCNYCGAVNAILKSQKNSISVTDECRITSIIDGICHSSDLSVTASPFSMKGNNYTILSIEDISEEKRKRLLERIFFHDIINTAGGVKAFLDHIKNCNDPEALKHFTGKAHNLSSMLLEEIQEQKDLVAAENDELRVKIADVSTLDVVYEAVEQVKFHRVAKDKNILIDDKLKDKTIQTDKVLLRRVLHNMLKNAVEASQEDDNILISAIKEAESITFKVNNPAIISDSVQKQIFQRSFSTKEDNRGIGTYSMKLLTEKYLKGKIYFTSTEEEGTTFYVEIKTRND